MSTGRPMRVLFLSHNFPRHSTDAAGSFILRLALALKQEEVDVHVVAPAGPGLAARETIQGIEVERFRYAPRAMEKLAYTGNMANDVKRSWSARVAMLGFLGADFVAGVMARRDIQPDVIHAHWWFPGGLVGSWVSGMAEIPLVTTLHGTDVRLARAVGAARPAFRHVLEKSTTVTTVSRWLAAETRALVPRIAPEVAPMPVDTERFTPDGEKRGDSILFVGRLNAQKGIEHVVRALPRLHVRRHLHVVGDGPAREGLQRLATELGVADNITWHGTQTHDAMPGFYQRAGTMVAPSIDEGLGLAAVEAQLCGTPVIASDSGGLTDVVQHDLTGLLVPVADPPALAAALNSLAANPERAATMGAAGRMHALATFAPESVARRYAELYRVALTKRT